jgi:hypothetical protein
VNYIYIEIADYSSYYYQDIKKGLQKTPVPSFPIPLMWSIDKITLDIDKRITSNDILRKLYKSKKYSIAYSFEQLEKYCEQIGNMIDPVIDTKKTARKTPSRSEK